jgi:hypothetical protein
MKTIFINLLMVVLLFVNYSDAQPAIQWQKCLGGTGSEEANSIIRTQDGGYAATGYSNSINGDVTGNHGQWDFWMVKLNMFGLLQSQKSFGGSLDESANSIIQNGDGIYTMAGWTNSNNFDVNGNHGGTDAWVIKLNLAGNIQWQKCLGGTGNEKANCIIPTQAGGYAIAGWTNSNNNGDVAGYHGGAGRDFWVVVLDGNGFVQWQKCLGGTDDDVAYSIIQVADGSFYVAGGTTSIDGDVIGNHGGVDYWVVKLSGAGVFLSQKCFGGSGGEAALSIIQTNDGGFALNGSSHSIDGQVTGNHGGADYWFVKTDNLLGLTNEISFGGANEDEGTSVIKTVDGGYALGGYSNSNNGDVTGNHGIDDYWLVKLDGLYNLQWQKSMGGANSDWAYSALQTNDAGYALAGFAWSNDGDVVGNHNAPNPDFWIVKLNPFFPLPVQLQSFSGRAAEQGNELYWTTATEINNDHFVIERSRDGIDFSALGKIKGNGNSQAEHRYSFTDKSPYAENNYYRLEQVNVDGAFTYSNIIRLTSIMKINYLRKVYPNPVTTAEYNLVIEYSLYHSGTVRLSLFNTTGQVIIEKNNKEQPAGNYKEIINLTGIAQGVYYLKWEAGDQVTTAKIVRE